MVALIIYLSIDNFQNFVKNILQFVVYLLHL